MLVRGMQHVFDLEARGAKASFDSEPLDPRGIRERSKGYQFLPRKPPSLRATSEDQLPKVWYDATTHGANVCASVASVPSPWIF